MSRISEKLIIIADNLAEYVGITSGGGHIAIYAARASMPALTTVGVELVIYAARTSGAPLLTLTSIRGGYNVEF